LPVTPIQILWVNLITAATLGIALAFEPTEVGCMQRPPRHREAPLLGGELIWHVVLVATLFAAAVTALFAYAIDRGHSVELARTLAVNALVVLEIFHLFFIRNLHGTSLRWHLIRGTPVVWLTVVVVTVAQFAITYIPALQRVFGTVAVPLKDGFLVVGVGFVLLLVLEAEKQARLRWRRRA